MTPEPNKEHARIDPVDRLLVGGIGVFVVLMILVGAWHPNDGQTFQVLTNLVAGFSGAFLGRLKQSESGKPGGGDAPK